MNKPYKESSIIEIKNRFLSITDEKVRTKELVEEKKWEEISTGPNCL